jgi:hypothetical protein
MYLTQGHLATREKAAKAGAHSHHLKCWLRLQLQRKFSRGFPAWLGAAENFSFFIFSSFLGFSYFIFFLFLFLLIISFSVKSIFQI